MILKRIINHSNVYLFGLMLLAAALPMSRYIMSVAQFILIGNWFLLNGNPIENARLFFKQKPALVFTSIYFLHILGLLYTNDFNYAFNDLRIKLPLLALPFIFATSEKLEENKFIAVLFSFIAGVIAETIRCSLIYVSGKFVDIRDISPDISHITLSLTIVFALFILGYFIFHNNKFNIYLKIFFGMIIGWLITFLFLLESLTGLITLLLTGIIYFICRVISSRKGRWYHKMLFMTGILFIPFSFIMYIFFLNTEMKHVHPVDFNKLDSITPLGNAYSHDTLTLQTENGYYLWIYYCQKEMRDTWNKKSKFDFDRFDRRGQKVEHTLARFLTSKGFRKDAEGINKLTTEEIHMIENGISNYKHRDNFNINSKFEQIFWAINIYKKKDDPNGNTLTQRLAYWDVAIKIISENVIWGVGTGDVKQSFLNYYEKTHSKLILRLRLRSHNQFMAICIAFGLIGFCWFLFGLLYPPIRLRMFTDYYFLIFFILSMLSFLPEDTLETQAGVSFFTFFYALLLFGKK